MFFRKLAGIVLAITLCSGALAEPDPWDLDVDIPYSLFKLDNGLTLIVHEDNKAPIVAVNIWYHVGSKDEEPGRTGFAHLFEHLMFNGSENYDNDYFKALEKVGATRLNGTTSWDRTNYFQNVPKSALDVVLWLESDRMGNLLGAVNQEKLDEQRGVVQNEKRQRENRPYGKAAEIQYRNIYPSNHPYSWTTIGSMEDLNAATLDDVHGWFEKYYGAANTVIAIAGDIKPEVAREKVEHYFGNIDPGPPLTKQASWPAKLSGSHRQISYDRVPQTMMLKSWNVEGRMTRDTNYLDMVAGVLSTGKNSRLYKRLVYDEQLASSVNAYISAGEIAGTFEIRAMINPGVKEEVVDDIIEEELAKFLEDGPTSRELERVKTKTISSFVKGIEQIGGFGGKSDILASNYVYTGDPAYYKKELNWIQNAGPDDLQKVANKWLDDGMYHLEIRPYPNLNTRVSNVDRSALPQPGEPPATDFDEFERAELHNGLSILFAKRDAVPVVKFRLSVDAGYASDQYSRPGVAKLAMNMLDEGTENRNALEINDELILLGADLGAGSNLDTSYVSLSSLTTTMKDSLKILADVVLNPAFPENELDRLRKQQLTAIRQEQSDPSSMALRVLPGLIYGDNHAYSNPLTGSGTIESVQNITLDELKAFHQTWFKPDNATMIVVGDTTMEEIRSMLKEAFADWQPGDVPEKRIPDVERNADNELYLLDRPGAEQSIILAGVIAPPKANPDEIAIEAMNSIIGGSFTSRINMNLREDKHWSYGASSGLIDARGQRTFYVFAGVQTDKTRESIQEINKELNGFVNDKPTTGEELDKTIKNSALSLSGKWETAGAVLGSLSEIVQYNLPDDYFNNYAEKIMSLKADQIDDVARKVIHPDALIWVVVGDRSVIEEELAKLNLGPVKVVDADGNIVE